MSLSDVHKTGLGSSAALITSLVGALLLYSQAVPWPSGDDTCVDLVHATSQAAHCIAQGKVGSGFDVAAAVFGSHKYTRFNPNVLAPLMNDSDDSSRIPLFPVLGPDNKAWDHKVEPFQLPPGTRLMLADVDAGSDTPSLVGKVLKWHKSAGDEGEELLQSRLFVNADRTGVTSCRFMGRPRRVKRSFRCSSSASLGASQQIRRTIQRDLLTPHTHPRIPVACIFLGRRYNRNAYKGS